MALTPARLAGPTVLGTSAADAYANGTGRPVVIRHVIIANPSSSSLTARLSILPGGVTADSAHILVPDLPIAAHDAFEESDWWQVLNPGDRISALASTGAVAVLTVSGWLT